MKKISKFSWLILCLFLQLISTELLAFKNMLDAVENKNIELVENIFIDSYYPFFINDGSQFFAEEQLKFEEKYKINFPNRDFKKDVCRWTNNGIEKDIKTVRHLINLVIEPSLYHVPPIKNQGNSAINEAGIIGVGENHSSWHCSLFNLMVAVKNYDNETVLLIENTSKNPLSITKMDFVTTMIIKVVARKKISASEKYLSYKETSILMEILKNIFLQKQDLLEENQFGLWHFKELENKNYKVYGWDVQGKNPSYPANNRNRTKSLIKTINTFRAQHKKVIFFAGVFHIPKFCELEFSRFLVNIDNNHPQLEFFYSILKKMYSFNLSKQNAARVANEDDPFYLAANIKMVEYLDEKPHALIIPIFVQENLALYISKLLDKKFLNLQ
jgi:hypothetical protein